jgi:hypothetical protein
VEVLDCTPEADGGPECCGSGTWVQGYLAYTYDQDWYSYRHPCPGRDCMVRVVYDFDQGPADFYLRVFQEGQAWFDNLSDTVEMETQSAESGYFGGLDADDYCFYAYQGHEGDPFFYYLAIRDTIYISEDNSEGGTWDWSADQAYRFCIEKIASECLEPCQLYEGECGAPASDD